MAPALTELSSQTNKLSSSATSASPRPSNNISESVSVSSSLGNLIATNHHNHFSNQPSDITETTAFDVSHKANPAKKFFNTDKKDTFQSAFEKFQQIRQQQENIVNNSSKSKKIFDCKSSLRTHENPETSSNLNGRVSNGQMGPMCDRNIEFQEIDNLVKKENKALQLVKDCVEIVATHMDFQDTVQISDLKDTQDYDRVTLLKHGNEIIRERIKIVKHQSSQDKAEDIQEYDDGPTQQQKPRPESVSANENAVANDSKTVNTSTSSLTPQTTTSSMGLQKDFIKESAEMEQVLGELGTSDMDLLQVLKGFDSTPGGEGAFCELSLFTDVDVMNYEEVPTQQAKDSETIEIRQEIEKRQLQMQRKCDFLLRRLRKIQARYMGKHATEEIAGIFEWQANPTLRRKEPIEGHGSYEEDKRHQISAAVMKSFVRRIKSVAEYQHSSLSMKRNKIGRPSNASIQQDLNVPQKKLSPFVPQINESLVAELSSVSGHLHSEFTEINSAIDSDATASSSGGDSADEMQQFNNTLQQQLPISKRATWTWVRDRAAIASRWTWLLAQISDLEYRIRQHNDLHHQIRKNKGVVCFDKGPPATTITPPNSPILPSSVNGFRGVLPGNSKSLDSDIPTSITPNGAYESLSSNQSGSCRTQAFQRTSFRKRKLLQTANVHTVSKKAARPSSVKCGCQWPLHPCGLCTGRPDPTAPRDLPDTMTSSEKVALLDSAFHPVLSFPEDVSQSIHVEATVRSPEWQNRAIRCTSKATPSTVKGAASVQKTDREERSKKYVDSRRKCNRKYPQDIVAANKLKISKARRPFQGDQCNNNLLKNKHRKVSNSITPGCGLPIGVGSNNGGGLSSTSSTGGSDSMGVLDSIYTSNGQLPRSKNSSPTPGSHIANFNKSERMDRRNRNSYDIDNIVIPYSVAASTRVEILPYKEIPTPKWRVLEDLDEHFSTLNTEDNHLDKNIDRSECTITSEKEYNLTSFYSGHENNNDEYEDISNESFLIRHERALIEERKKFQTYLKYPWSTRSRANRRTDSRAESSGANTPDPSSPASNTPNLCGDVESVPSPSAPSTPQTPLDTVDESSGISQGTPAVSINHQQSSNNYISAAKRTERKRTASGRKEREQSKEEMVFNIISDQKEYIPPYEPLEFPLSDDTYKTMLELMPNEHQILEDCLERNTDTSVKALENGAADEQISAHVETNPIQMDDTEDRNLIISDDKQNSVVLDLLNVGTNNNLIAGDSDTDSAESGIQYEDPNDPEWREPE